MMPIQSHSNSQLANMSSSLQRLADRLRGDRNESRLLVHETLMTAFAVRADQRPTGDEGRALRRWMISRLRAGHGRMARAQAAAAI